MLLNMSDREEIEETGMQKPGQPEAEQPSRGPSLVLLFTLVGIALLAATVLAALIVLPFYEHRH